MTGALLRIDIRGRGGVSLQGQVERGAEDLSRPHHGGLPQPVHHHRAGQPVGADQHAAVDRAACRLDRRLPRRTAREGRHARSRPSREAEEAWVGHVGEAAGNTLRSTCSSWYVGANIPGKPRVFMPYIGGLPAYIERCEAVVKNGYEGFSLSS